MIFKKETLTRPVTNSTITGVLEQGCEFEGKLSFEGTVRIGGIFKGEIFTRDTLVVAEGALVKAEIEAGTVIINGEVTGNINAHDRVEIHYPAIFRGTITSPSLQVDEGVIFEGKAKMTGDRFTPPGASFSESSQEDSSTN